MLKLRPAPVALLAVALFTLLMAQTASGNSTQEEARAIFGTVLSVSRDHPRAVAGEMDITVGTFSGSAELTATFVTVVRVPGQESATGEDLRPGDPVAVLASGSNAVNILVRSHRPVETRHLTGVVISVDAEAQTISLESSNGERVSAPALPDLRGLQAGRLVTAVMEQDLGTGALVVTGLDPATEALARITVSMATAEKSGVEPVLNALKERLISNSTRHLSALGEASQRADPSLLAGVRQEQDLALEAYATALSRYESGKPRVEVTGIIASIDRERRRVTVQPQGLEAVEVEIPASAGLWRTPAGLSDEAAETWVRGGPDTRAYAREVGGSKSRFEQLDLASRVRLWYELDSFRATRALVLPGADLEAGKVGVLLSLAQIGEATGRVIAVDEASVPPTVTIQDEISVGGITLTLPPIGQVLEGDTPAASSSILSFLLSSLLGSSVAVGFDPGSMAVTQLNILSPGATSEDRQDNIYGVVHSFISKLLPGNLNVLTPDGSLRALNHTADTTISRDGLRATIGQVRIGDLVRPNTQYQTGSQDLVTLNLKSPRAAPVRGAIRGISTYTDGQILLTISNSLLELVNVRVTGDTGLTGPDGLLSVSDLAVGQRVTSGAYDPISDEASRMVIGPPHAVLIRGEIAVVDAHRSSLTITPIQGEPVELLASESTPTKIYFKGAPDARFGDLRPGQRVRIGFYDPVTKEIIKLRVD